MAQGAETRTFNYDSLKRLSSAVNPESGTVSYTYDANANLLTKKDARNVTTTYSYDALNRKLGASYSDGTPASSYQYDAAGTYSIGRLTTESNQNSATNYTAYDALGRVTAGNQQTGGWTYGFSYSYNLAGSLTNETYPSGRVVTTGYDAANRASQVTGTHGNSSKTYVSGGNYWPHGALNYYTFGNALWRVFTYNSRLQPGGLWDAINNDGSKFLFLENPITYGATNNNGNVQSLILYASAPGQPGVLTGYSQSFTYDTLNRLTSATDSGGWWRNYAYDQYGNGWVPSTSTQMSYGPATPAWNVYNSKNQIGSVQFGDFGSGVPDVLLHLRSLGQLAHGD